MATDDSPPRKTHIETLVQLERMKVWRQALVAHTRNSGANDWSDGSVRARDWADAALEAFDKQFGTGK